ncbi:MAG: hypothetical protein L0H70_07250, partial [Xanthomonadales bacterium]|nr:hypothetical protein [Xanthomonadales bacterium]
SRDGVAASIGTALCGAAGGIGATGVAGTVGPGSPAGVTPKCCKVTLAHAGTGGKNAATHNTPAINPIHRHETFPVTPKPHRNLIFIIILVPYCNDQAIVACHDAPVGTGTLPIIPGECASPPFFMA